MSKFWRVTNWNDLPSNARAENYGAGLKIRIRDQTRLKNHFDEMTLEYLDEKIIDYLADSLQVVSLGVAQHRERFHDFSFITAPAYKAFEGYLFQIARDLDLPSAKPDFVGTYFDEEKVDKAVNKILKELADKSDESSSLGKPERQFVKDMIGEMKRFLYHYRHTPAHFHSERLDTIEKAEQNILSMYRIINETTKTLIRAKLVSIKNDFH